ncbi:MAG: fimbria/pilus outer membrane usher protein [Pseudomonadota bacterium]
MPELRRAAEEWMVLVREYPNHAGITQDVLRTAEGFSAPLEVLHDWRITPAAAPRRHEGRDWYLLSDIPGMTQSFDACAQALELGFSKVQRAAQLFSMRPAQAALTGEVTTGGFINLDFQYSSMAGQGATASLLEGGFFSALGRGGQTVLMRDAQVTRLESFWVRESPESMTTLRLGDAINHAGSWGRAVRFAGAQWGTDFSLQPYFSTFPQPVIRGDAVLPSTLEVFVDGQRRSGGASTAGPFELRDIPTLSGAGEALVVVRDALGRETRVAQPFYSSPSLLRDGLRDYALEAGALRRDYGIASANYGDIFASGTLRQGLSDRLTGELRAEFQADRAAGGIGGVGLIGNLGLFSATAVYGQNREGGGWQGALGFERDVPGVYSFALRSQWMQPGFTQVGQAENQPPSRRLDLARFSVQPRALGLPVAGSLSLLWTHEDSRSGPDIELRSAAYGVQIGDGYLNLGYTETCAPDCQPSARLDFTYSFGQTSAAFQHEHTDNADISRLSVQRNSAGPLGLDWRAAVERGGFGSNQRGEISAAWKTNRGTLTADLVHDADFNYRVGAATGIAFLGSEAFWTRPVNGSFAVVRTGGLADVGITADGRSVGRTDKNGNALVPDLRAYEINRLSLAVEDIPIEADLSKMTLDLVPRGRSGLFADFGVGP